MGLKAGWNLPQTVVMDNCLHRPFGFKMVVWLMQQKEKNATGALTPARVLEVPASSRFRGSKHSKARPQMRSQ